MPDERFMRHHYGASGYVEPGAQRKAEAIMNCQICGQLKFADHSCAGGAPASNLPKRGEVCTHPICGCLLRCRLEAAPEPLVSLSEMNRRIAEAVAAEREACIAIAQEACCEFECDRRIARKIRERGSK